LCWDCGIDQGILEPTTGKTERKQLPDRSTPQNAKFVNRRAFDIGDNYHCGSGLTKMIYFLKQ
jgi:hypothetical protein